KKKPGKEMFKGRDIEWKEADGKIPYLETSIDKFYHLVKERKRINFYDAAKEYGVNRDQIASWARILEDHKLAKVHYPVFGSPVVLIETEKPKKEEEREEEKPKKKAPKIIIALIGGLMVFFGYVMLVSNPFTITMRSQLASIIGRLTGLFAIFPYPLNIITPVIIIIALLWLVAGLRHKRKSTKDNPSKEGTKKRPKDIEGKIGKIKEELGS
ncbi:MAG: hypothetical protein NTY20_00970, partial [Candidatus Aenigmarchaeota archaeon]|nr:hypothetical protein [Candidatus Aenigmarchaeota archaeon]